ncbi:hypothetical protein RJ641_020669 [Dillenia turbinata]|uniref:RING-type E3 ubiquitin transferase n=1 Tax=Dillenia turbinata TaxID=194707 RepID=A0AAN8UU61_9MAGN
MGHFLSKPRYQNHNNYHTHSNPSPPLPLPTPPPNSLPRSHPQPSSTSSSNSYANPLPLPQPPPQPTTPPAFCFAANSPYPTPPLNPYPYYTNNQYYYQRPFVSSSNYQPFCPNQQSYWPPGFRPPPPRPVAPFSQPPLQQPVPYVDHQSAKKIKNDVNVHKETIKVEVDENHGDCHLVTFTFDALVDGSITIFYFAKEWTSCTFSPAYPEIFKPVKIPFNKGLGQKFRQPSGTGIDFGFFEFDDLSKPSPGEVIFPLVISAEASLTAETSSSSPAFKEQLDQPQLITSPRAQITQAVLEHEEGKFQVRVVKQILCIDGVRYELREIYGISNMDEEKFDDGDTGKECVICMTEAKDTAVLPCRHMCMCSECAKALRLQSNKCPMCRQPIQELIEIKVNAVKG